MNGRFRASGRMIVDLKLRANTNWGARNYAPKKLPRHLIFHKLNELKVFLRRASSMQCAWKKQTSEAHLLRGSNVF
jgi:hypothetical protein